MPRPGSRPTRDGLRHSTSWILGSFLQFPLWFCNTQPPEEGDMGAREVLESHGGKTKATLTPGPRTCATWPSGDRTGWLVVLIMATPCRTRKLVWMGPRADHSPIHFLWTWTLAYSEKDGSGLGAGWARLRWTMSRSA